jgi:hypothetical protein
MTPNVTSLLRLLAASLLLSLSPVARAACPTTTCACSHGRVEVAQCRFLWCAPQHCYGGRTCSEICAPGDRSTRKLR